MKISVIIPTYNRISSLIETLDSYSMSIEKPFEILVIDQSKENYKKKLENRYKNLNIKYFRSDIPSGTIARNIGIKNSKGDILLFSDDDIEIEKDTLVKMKEIFLKDKKISLIGGWDSYRNGEMNLRKIFTSSVVGRKNILKALKLKGYVTSSIYGRFPEKMKEENETEWAMGFFFSVRKTLLDKWNILFDENFISYAYAEDLYFTHTYYKAGLLEGYKMIYSDKIKVKHNCSQEYRIPKFKQILMIVIHRKYIFNKLKKNFLSLLIFEIADFFECLRLFVKREGALNFIKAKILCYKYEKELKKGIINKKLKSLMGN